MPNWLFNKAKKPASLADAATRSTLKPGDFPVGSLESRAAARALVEDRDKAREVIQIVFVSPDGAEVKGPKLKIGN